MYIFNSQSMLIFTVIILLNIPGCGFFSPDFENYEENNTSSNTPADKNTACGAKAFALFEANLSSGIKGTCAKAGCHASGTGSAKLNLQAGSVDSNRSKIFSYTGLDRNKLTNYISSAQHGGGNQGSVLPVEKVGPWIDKEKECQP